MRQVNRGAGWSWARVIIFILCLGLMEPGAGLPGGDGLADGPERKIYEVTQASPNLPIWRGARDSINLSRILELREMLKNREFDKLNAALEEYQKVFEEKPAGEYYVYDAYRALESTDPAYEEVLKAWVSTCPDSYQPYLVMAKYYYDRGWESRGHKYFNETTNEQIDGMQHFFSAAQESFESALKIKPDLMPVYLSLIGMANALGKEDKEDALCSQATELFPRSYLVRNTCSWAKEPRWGGSYVEMEAVAKSAEPYANVNPELTVLYGFIYEDQAFYLEKDSRHQEALDLLDKALSFGDSASFYREKATIYQLGLKDYDHALDNVNRSLAIRPISAESFVRRSKIYLLQGDYEASLADLKTAEEINPGEAQEWKDGAPQDLLNDGHRLFKTDLKGAIAKYDWSIKFNSRNFEAYFWRAKAYSQLKDYTPALADFKQAVALDPRHLESYQWIDYILSTQKKWDEVIGYWNTFIRLEPEKAEAYYARAGAYFHKGDMVNCKADADKACRLGSQAGCTQFNKMAW